MIPFLVDFNFLIYSNFDVNYAGAAIRMCIPNMVTSLFDFEKKNFHPLLPHQFKQI